MQNKLVSGAGLVVALVALLAVNIYSNLQFTGARIDLTENGAYTLSQGTRNILGAIEEPVILRLFLSEQLARRNPSIASYANRVRDMLFEYQRHADGLVQLEIIDPEPFSEAEDRALSYGLQGIPLDAEGTNFYFGLVGTNSTDGEVVVPYLAPEREAFLEYDLSKVLWQLRDVRTPVVGVISSLPINGMDQRQAMMMGNPGAQPWMVMDQIGQTFDVRDLDGDLTRVPDEVDVLMLVHPKNLPDATLYAIDQFVLGGGRLLLFLDPNAETEQPNPMQPMPGFSRASQLDTLLQAWGIEFDASRFVADLSHALTVRFQREGRLITLEYPAWMELPAARLRDDDIVTGNLGKLVFASPGALSLRADSPLTLTPLVQTSDQAMLVESSMLDPSRDPQDLLRGYQPGGEALVLAARLTGPLTSAFADGAPAPDAEQAPAAEGESSPAPAAPDAVAHLGASTEPVNMLVVADTDFLEDRFWVQVQNLLGSRLAVPTAGNGGLVVNALDNLTGSNDLISVRSRAGFSRPFTRIDDIRREAELRFREKEQELTAELSATEAKLVELEQAKPQDGEALVLSSEQAAEIERFRDQKIAIRKELRDVLHERRSNIEALEFRLRMLNIGLMPLLIVLAGVLVAAWQYQRRRSVASAAPAA